MYKAIYNIKPGHLFNWGPAPWTQAAQHLVSSKSVDVACGALAAGPPPRRTVSQRAVRRMTPEGGARSYLSGPETGKRKRGTRKADGKLTLLVNLGGSWHEKLTLLVAHFSLPILAHPVQGD